MHPLRLLSLVIAVLLAGTTLAAASSLDTAIARFTGTTDGRSAYIQAVEVRFGTAKESNAGCTAGSATRRRDRARWRECLRTAGARRRAPRHAHARNGRRRALRAARTRARPHRP